MKSCTRHNGRLEIVRREPNSHNGNPRYLLKVAGWTCYTAPDSSLGYKVQNMDGKKVQAVIGTHYGRPTLDSVQAID